MKIINKDFEREISSLILQKAKYQKVVVCYDDSADGGLIDALSSRLGKQVVLINFYLNQNIQDYFNVVQNGVRLVVYCVDANNYLKIKDDNNYLIKIFVPTEGYYLPYLTAGESVYCNNMFVANVKMDYLSIIALYDAGLSKLWADLQIGNDIDLVVFKQIDGLVNDKSTNIFPLAEYLSRYVDADICEKELPYYIYLKFCYIYKMLENFAFNEETVVDFYKLNLSHEELNKAYAVVVKSEIAGYLKLYCSNIMRVVSALITRVKILIKKYFKNNQINIKKIDEKLKQNAKYLKIDNLLYISYIFGAF